MSKRGFARLTVMLSAVAVASFWALPAGASAQFLNSFNDNATTTTDSFNTTIGRQCSGGFGGTGGGGGAGGEASGGTGGGGGGGVNVGTGVGNVGIGGGGGTGGGGGDANGGSGGDGGAGGDVDCSNTSGSFNTVGNGGGAGDGGGGAGGGGALAVGGVPLAKTGFNAWMFALLGGLFLAGGIALLAAQRPGGIRRR
jgi:hypothetical protein